MRFHILFGFFLLIGLMAVSQDLTYKSGGRIFDSNNKKLSPKEVRALLAAKPGMLKFYNEGRSKKTTGNILLYGGMATLATDFIIAANKESVYPTPLTYLGIGTVILAIPVKAGFSKKIKTVVKDYNAELSAKDTGFNIESVLIVSGGNTLGVRITF